jgi:hypothetical protein
MGLECLDTVDYGLFHWTKSVVSHPGPTHTIQNFLLSGLRPFCFVFVWLMFLFSNTPSSQTHDPCFTAIVDCEVLSRKTEILCRSPHNPFIPTKYCTMPTEEELTAQIAALGEKIKQAKADKKPKEEWEPFLQEMLALKVCCNISPVSAVWRDISDILLLLIFPV